MRQFCVVLAMLLAALLAACGGSDDGPRFSAQVIFGDSLADVGTDNVGAIAAGGGGRFTINGNNTAVNSALTGQVWSEVIAVQLGLPTPCAAQTGLNGDAAFGFSVPVVNHPGCLGYAQPGARVTAPVGPRHRLTGSPLGQLTVPVVTQIANHLAATGGRFTGNEVVFVTAGGNDAIFLLDQLAAGTTSPAAAVAAMATAGAELADLVRNRIVANGANYIVVNNLPDISVTPLARLQAPPTQALIAAMVDAFNTTLREGLAGAPQVLQIDLFAFTRDQAANPAAYGLTNVTTAACGPNVLGGSALLCNASNLKPGDVSHFMFADDAHPTPYEHALVARFIAQRMAANGWL
jgi:outer membrane lipase/esterase